MTIDLGTLSYVNAPSIYQMADDWQVVPYTRIFEYQWFTCPNGAKTIYEALWLGTEPGCLINDEEVITKTEYQ